MIIPSIDLMNGVAVQLVGGREKRLDAGDPVPIARAFAIAGEVAVIDLDAAIGTGSNEAVIRTLLEIGPCRVGGGIRTYEKAVEWLDAGARKIIIGTAATPGLLRRLPRERIIAALDAEHGEVVTHGWRTRSGAGIVERMRELREFVGGFLITSVEREGRMEGIDLEEIRNLLTEAGEARITFAGGVTTVKEVAAIDELGADAQVGMALYTGRMHLADGIAAPLHSDRPDGLWPTVVVDERGIALGLAYSNLESVRRAVELRRGVYFSRTRGIWIKGGTSGAVQDLLRIDLDCDRDALRFTVLQHGPGFCHKGTATCWGENCGLTQLMARIKVRAQEAPAGSYTERLLEDGALLRAKLLEEAAELAGATSAAEAVHEAADLMYFTSVALARAGISLAEVERELDRRALKVSRRPGDAKPAPEGRTA